MKSQLEGHNEVNRKIIRRKKKVLLVIIVILIVGIVYEKFGEYLDSKRFQPVGQIINVNGHNMHIFAKGKGSVTVVFTSGWRTPSPYVDYYPLYNEISKRTRIAVYDRAGYGWSDVANTSRDIDTIAKELHQLLEKSGEKPPYILVGHSFGSNEVLRFAQMYKSEVKGVVLIDGSNPEYTSTIKRPSNFILWYGTLTSSIVNNSINLANNTGITRLLSNIPNFYSSVSSYKNGLSLAPEDLKELDKAMFLKNLNNKNQRDELRMDASEIVANRYIEDVPLRIITSEEYNNSTTSKKIQMDLKKWSNNSKQIFVARSRHYVHWFNPEPINNEILELLKNQ